MNGMLSPYWWVATPSGARRPNIVRGIYHVTTNAVELNTDVNTVDYGVNPRDFIGLPAESVVLLSFSADTPDSGDALPVILVTPGGDTSTLGTAGKARMAVVDSDGDEVLGSSVAAGSARLAYVNKATGVVKLLGYINS